MVAFNSTRRIVPPAESQADGSTLALIERQTSGKLGENASVRGSRRYSGNVETVRDGSGKIIQARIGRWRVISAAVDRDIVEVHEASCGRIAIRLSRCANRHGSASCEVWQLYDAQGRLLASLQRSADGRMAVVADYETRRASRLMQNRAGEMVAVESWSI